MAIGPPSTVPVQWAFVTQVAAHEASVTPAGGCATKLCHSPTLVVGMYSLNPVALAFVTFLHTPSGPVIDTGVLSSAVYESDA
jgi:hypothetical protein